jgi:SAM-dependent methyltransferase
MHCLQRTPFRGVGGYSVEAFQSRGVRDSFPQATREAQCFEDFFGLFPRDVPVREMFMGKDVLDFGSGYGGRTVEYLRQCGANRVWGVEPFQAPVDLSNAYAASLGVSRCEFRLCTQHEIPLPDAAVDVVVSYDVLEHVENPKLSTAEIRRVLRPGGRALLVFPVYDGAVSHHLDYIVRLPGLHWLFRPETLVGAVNRIVGTEAGKQRFGTPVQPQPRLSYDGSRRVLPTLNGLTGDGFQQMLEGFEPEVMYFRPLLSRRPILGAPLRLLMKAGARGLLRDAFTANVACVLRKR